MKYRLKTVRLYVTTSFYDTFFLNFEYTNYILNILNFVPFSEVKTDFKKKIFALIKSLFYKRTFAIKNRKQCPFFIISQILKIKNELSPFFI